MKVVILAGGLGTRLSEETVNIPKPMVEIGGMPILWHIMKIYSFYGLNEFIICCGYKGYFIKKFFLDYYKFKSDFEINLKNNEIKYYKNPLENWKVSLLDTGLNAPTGERILKLKDILKSDENFYLTYGDGLANVDIKKLTKNHFSQNKICTMTAVPKPGRFGSIKIKKNKTLSFQEKPELTDEVINGGFFLLNNKIFKYLKKKTSFESYTLQKLAKKNQININPHNKFWMPMDTLRDKNQLEELWKSKKAPWKIWP